MLAAESMDFPLDFHLPRRTDSFLETTFCRKTWTRILIALSLLFILGFFSSGCIQIIGLVCMVLSVLNSMGVFGDGLLSKIIGYVCMVGSLVCGVACLYGAVVSFPAAVGNGALATLKAAADVVAYTSVCQQSINGLTGGKFGGNSKFLNTLGMCAGAYLVAKSVVEIASSWGSGEEAAQQKAGETNTSQKAAGADHAPQPSDQSSGLDVNRVHHDMTGDYIIQQPAGSTTNGVSSNPSTVKGLNGSSTSSTYNASNGTIKPTFWSKVGTSLHNDAIKTYNSPYTSLGQGASTYMKAKASEDQRKQQEAQKQARTRANRATTYNRRQQGSQGQQINERFKQESFYNYWFN